MERDYLLRQIEKMGVILAGIRQLVFGGEPVRAMVELRQEAARAGLGLEFLDALAAESLLEILGESNLEKLIPAGRCQPVLIGPHCAVLSMQPELRWGSTEGGDQKVPCFPTGGLKQG